MGEQVLTGKITAALGVDVHLRPQSAERTRFPGGTFDATYSRILLHETSAECAPAIFAECHRLLRPGAVMLHSDASQFEMLDAYAASLRDCGIRLNGEPYMDGCHALPLPTMFEAAGFAAADVFQTFTLSLAVQRDAIDPSRLRTNGGRCFLAGAVKTG